MSVLVTGATGHLGNNLCQMLGRDGREFKAMIRSGSDLTPLEDIDAETVEANLLNPDSLREALRDIQVVFHTAAVYKFGVSDPELQIIKPAVEGTRNLFNAARDRSVRKIVYVSSVVAIGPGDDFNHDRTTADWNNEAVAPYNIAKTRSEQVAHELSEEYGITTIFVLPTMMLGPRDYKITPSTAVVRDFLRGRIPFGYEAGYSVVDIRDVAQGMLLAEQYATPGKRYILGGTAVTFQELLDQLAEMTTRSAPTLQISRQLANFVSYPVKWMADLFNFNPLINPESVKANFGKYYNFSSEEAQKDLGYNYRSLLRVLEDTINWLVERGEIPEEIRVVENA
mgnify:CR=1 FL=1